MTHPLTPEDMAGVSPRAVRRPRWSGREFVGRLFVWTSGIHVGIAAVHPGIYRHFADAAVSGWIERGWNEVFVANPRPWGLAVAAGELLLGLLLLHGGRAAKVGWVGVIVFHLALVLFGWIFLLYAAPAVVVLVVLARRDWTRLTAPEPSSDLGR